MDKYITSSEASVKWNISPRTVTGLCKKGKIRGAYKTGKYWYIPSDAEKPSDERIKSGIYIKSDKNTRPMCLPLGISDYRTTSTSYYYIDKTMLIKELIDEMPPVTLFTRPRRFGKTLTMDMLRTFFEKTEEDTSKYFLDKKIWSQGSKYINHQGKYPVISLTFKDTGFDNWDDTYKILSSVIRKEYDRHNCLSESNKLSITEKKYFNNILYGTAEKNDYIISISMLSEMLYKHYGEKVIIIIDEYDTPVIYGYSNNYYDEIIAFMRNCLSACFKDNKSLAFGFLTGILRVAKESIFSGLNNLQVDSVLDNHYSQYFGFTKDEVYDMTCHFNKADKFEEIRQWYDGYQFGNTEIFNPWSVLNYFRDNCTPRPYWISTSSNDIINNIISNADEETYTALSNLVCGKTLITNIDTAVVFPQINSDPSVIYSFLLVTGYLKAIKPADPAYGHFIYEVAIPNKEISYVFRKEILNRISNAIPRRTIDSVEFALIKGNASELKDAIRNFLAQSASFFDTTHENFYHGFMLGMCVLFENYYTSSNRESGEGRFDIQLEPRNTNLPGIIIELKANMDCTDTKLKEVAEEALHQISKQKYDSDMIYKGVRTIYKYGVAFCGKKVEIAIAQ